MSEFGKTEAALLAFGVAGALALTGCSSDSPDTSSSSSSASTSEAAPVSPNVTVSADHVDPSEVGALFDRGLDAAREINDTDAASSIDAAAKAYRDAGAIPNPFIRDAASAYVSWELAHVTYYADQDIYTYSDEPLDSTKKNVTADEAAMEKITDPNIKAVAETNLDYIEATSALDASQGNRAPKTVAYLLTTIENPDIAALATSAIGGNIADQQKLHTDAGPANTAVDQGDSAAFMALYAGSNTKADDINKSIEALNNARHAAGD